MKRFLIDFTLFALFVAELCFQYLPRYLHEILGLVVVVFAIVHFANNFRRFSALFKKVTPKKFFAIEVTIALSFCVLIILITGLCMSNYVSPDFANPTLRRNMTIHTLHTATPYIMTVLIGMHLGLHWRTVEQQILKTIGLEKLFKRRRLFFKVVVATLAAFGVLGLYLNRFLDRILMKHIFATPATDLHVVMFIFLLVGSITLFATVTFIIVERYFKE